MTLADYLDAEAELALLDQDDASEAAERIRFRMRGLWLALSEDERRDLLSVTDPIDPDTFAASTPPPPPEKP